MGSYTPNIKLYKPDIGETGWGDKVNQNFDVIDDLISRIRIEMLTMALNIMMHKALLNAETKDFKSIIADVITADYPNGFKNTLETPAVGVAFDNDGGGTWTQAIKIPLTTVPSEYAQYKIVIQSNTMQIYSADGTLKVDYGANFSVASDFWNGVKSDGSDIRIADQNYSQLYFWIEQFDYDNQTCVLWVKIPENTTEVYIAYGNPSATKSSYEDYTKVATVVVDDFEDGDTSDWVVDGGGSADNFYADSSVVKFGNYSGHLKDPSSGATERHYKQFSSLTEDFTIEFWLLAQSLGTADATYDKITLTLQDTSLTIGAYIPSVEVSPRQFVYKDGEWKALTDLTLNTWYKLKTNFRFSDQTYDVAVYDNEGNLLASVNNLSLVNSVSEISVFHIFSWLKVTCDINIDQILIYKLTDPAEFGDAETVTLTTTGDFTTITFNFPSGIDKLLITVDTDATAIYYSTDDGNTWNPINPDEETPLPETAYSIKWKFEFASYVRGYAFITW